MKVQIQKVPLRSGMNFGFSFFKLFRYFFFSIFILYFVISIFITGIYKQDLNIIINELGSQFLNPIELASNTALEIKENGLGLNIFQFYYHIYKIYLWVFVFLKLIKFFAGDRLSPFERLFFAISIFLVIEFIYVTIETRNANYLFTLIKNVFDGVIYAFTNFDFSLDTNINANIFNVNNTCTDPYCTA